MGLMYKSLIRTVHQSERWSKSNTEIFANKTYTQSDSSKMTASSSPEEPKLTDKERLAPAKFRAHREYNHWYRGGLRFCHHYLSIDFNAPLPRLTLGEVQDCGNSSIHKSTPDHMMDRLTSSAEFSAYSRHVAT